MKHSQFWITFAAAIVSSFLGGGTANFAFSWWETQQQIKGTACILTPEIRELKQVATTHLKMSHPNTGQVGMPVLESIHEYASILPSETYRLAITLENLRQHLGLLGDQQVLLEKIETISTLLLEELGAYCGD